MNIMLLLHGFSLQGAVTGSHYSLQVFLQLSLEGKAGKGWAQLALVLEKQKQLSIR